MRISDWSSDVCSSDLALSAALEAAATAAGAEIRRSAGVSQIEVDDDGVSGVALQDGARIATRSIVRLDARRVRKECVSKCRSRWTKYHKKKEERQTQHNKTTNQQTKA